MMRQRWNARRQTQTTPLVLLAGFPQSICGVVVSATERNLSPSHRVISAPSGSDDTYLYRVQTVSTIFKAVSEYSVKRRKATTGVLTPTQILLAYVPAADDERLLAEFDFFVFPVPLARLAEYDENGRQYRHDLKVACEYVAPSIENALRTFVEIKRRLSSLNWRESLFLPPRNFKVSDTERMVDILREMRRGARPWGPPLSIQTTRVTHEQLPVRLPEGASKDVLRDCRGLLFPLDRGRHGPVRELNADCSDLDRKQFMQSSFRLGAPLVDGLHHDVQYGGRSLGGEVFECSRKGPIELSSAYANVYPDDFVRPSNE